MSRAPDRPATNDRRHASCGRDSGNRIVLGLQRRVWILSPRKTGEENTGKTIWKQERIEGSIDYYVPHQFLHFRLVLFAWELFLTAHLVHSVKAYKNQGWIQ